MPKPTVVFDLDGTLVDTAPDLIHACNHVLGEAGVGPVGETLLRPHISFGSRRMILVGLGHHGVTMPDQDVDRLWAKFLTYYSANIAVDSRPYPHVVDVLERLALSGVRLAVCTNKVEALSRQVLEALDLARYFGAVCGRDTFPVCKPDPRHLTGAIDAVGGSIHSAVMVGDSDTDVATARAAGVPIIGLGFGYTDVPMRDLAPDALIDTYQAFDDALLRVMPH